MDPWDKDKGKDRDQPSRYRVVDYTIDVDFDIFGAPYGGYKDVYICHIFTFCTSCMCYEHDR